MPTYKPINDYVAMINCPSPSITSWTTNPILTSTNAVNIPPEFQDISEHIVESTDAIVEDKNELITDIGIAAAVKVCSCQLHLF